MHGQIGYKNKTDAIIIASFEKCLKINPFQS